MWVWTTGTIPCFKFSVLLAIEVEKASKLIFPHPVIVKLENCLRVNFDDGRHTGMTYLPKVISPLELYKLEILSDEIYAANLKIRSKTL